MGRKVTTYTKVSGLNRALTKLPKVATAELRTASADIAGAIVREVAGVALRIGGPARLVAPTLRATRDRVPVVAMGGNKKLPESGTDWQHSRRGPRQTIGDVIFGAEFGGGARPTTQQFRPHRGTRGYFLWPTVRARSDETQERYSAALLTALRSI